MRGAVLAALGAFALSAPASAAEPATPAFQAAPQASLLGPVLVVNDIARALAYYTDGLGLSLAMQMGPESRREYMLRFGADPAAAGIILIHDGTARDLPPIAHPRGFDRLVLRVADLDAMAARLDAKGFPHSPIRDVAMGYRMMTATDTDGYKLELVQSARAR